MAPSTLIGTDDFNTDLQKSIGVAEVTSAVSCGGEHSGECFISREHSIVPLFVEVV